MVSTTDADSCLGPVVGSVDPGEMVVIAGVVDVEGSGMEVEGSSVDVEGSGMDVEGNRVDVEGPGMDVEGRGCEANGVLVSFIIFNTSLATFTMVWLSRDTCLAAEDPEDETAAGTAGIFD